MKSREEVELLKSNWSQDPCWDIEHSEGFEDYYNELVEFSEQHRKQNAIRWTEYRKTAFKQECAFPTDTILDGRSGLSRRDYFVAAVLSGLCAQEAMSAYEKENLADWAIEIADCTLEKMIK